MSSSKKRRELDRAAHRLELAKAQGAHLEVMWRAAAESLAIENSKLIGTNSALVAANGVLGSQNMALKKALLSKGYDWRDFIAGVDLAEVEARQMPLIPRFVEEDTGNLG